MAEHQVLFCPFCRESFEGLHTCPDHDLKLVPFDRLPRDPHAAVADRDEDEPAFTEDSALGPFEPRFGRAPVGLGAVLNALALGLEFVRFPDGTGVVTWQLASSLPGLWSLGLVSFTLLFVLRRGTTLRKLRALRVLVPALACFGPLLLGWELHRIRQGALLWAPLVRSADVRAGSAVYVVCVAALLIGYGGIRLGVRKEE
jgi:hypothetical protein